MTEEIKKEFNKSTIKELDSPVLGEIFEKMDGEIVEETPDTSVPYINDEAVIDTVNSFEEAIVDAEAKVIESKDDVAADIFIKTVTPYKITFAKKDNKDIAIIIFLCRDDNDNLFIIDRNIPINNADHISDLECIPFAEDKDYDFVNEKICTNLLMGYLDNYVCDMKFKISKEDINSTNPVLTTTLTNVKTRQEKIASIGADTFAALTFIDNYISEDIINEHDLALAVIAGSKDNSNAEFFVVDSVEKIVAMAPAKVDLNDEKKGFFDKIKSVFVHNEENEHPTSIGMVVKVSRFIDGGKEVLQLLTPFDIGVEFEESKFKGNTITWIENNYFGDADQYVTTLTINSITLDGIDKTFMIIRAKSKTGNVKLFLLDSSIQKELQDMINEY